MNQLKNTIEFDQLQNSIEKQKMLSEQKTLSRNIQSSKEIKKLNQRTRWRKQKSSGPPIFISKTYQILENNIYKDVITWNEQGTNFIIIDVERFEEEVLPIHFRHRNFSSFVRQLNMYDFHKIRNDNNKNIFQHKQFKRDHRQALRNIKRKGCNGKRGQESQENMSISDHDELAYDIEETPRQEDKYHQTIESIEKICHESPIASIRIIHAPITPSPEKKQKIQEFMNSLPQIITTEEEIQQKINELKKDPKYEILNTKKDIRKLISKIRRKIPRKEMEDDLQELSIEEEIIADKIIDPETLFDGIINPTLAVLSTERFLPKSINLIGSMNFCDDADHLLFQRMY